jgi:hypothetical protein
MPVAAPRRIHQESLSSLARDSLARLTASRRFVFTLSPGFLGISEGAHDALVAEALDQPVEPLSRRPRFVAESQFTVFCPKFGNEFAHRNILALLKYFDMQSE